MMPRVDESAIDELRDFVAGDLPQEQRAAVEESLRTDPALREARELVKLEQQSVRQWAHRRMPVGDFDELYARVSSRLGERPRASEATGGSGIGRWRVAPGPPPWGPAPRRQSPGG